MPMENAAGLPGLALNLLRNWRCRRPSAKWIGTAKAC
jgi:hypothetical protein